MTASAVFVNSMSSIVQRSYISTTLLRSPTKLSQWRQCIYLQKLNFSVTSASKKSNTTILSANPYAHSGYANHDNAKKTLQQIFNQPCNNHSHRLISSSSLIASRHFSQQRTKRKEVIEESKNAAVPLDPNIHKEVENNEEESVRIMNDDKSKSDLSIEALGNDLKEDWKMIYRFPHVRAARTIQKLKIIQTFITTFIGLPLSAGLYFFGKAEIETVVFMMGASTFACVMLYVMGSFCARLIGMIYVSKVDPSVVRIAHLDFWGRREDNLLRKTDFVPFSDLPDNVSDVYVNVKFYPNADVDEEDKMHICIRYGEVYDEFEFEEIFGAQTGAHVVKSELKNSKK